MLVGAGDDADPVVGRVPGDILAFVVNEGGPQGVGREDWVVDGGVEADVVGSDEDEADVCVCTIEGRDGEPAAWELGEGFEGA